MISQTPIWLRILMLLAFSSLVASQTIVEYLPGYSGKLPFTLETGYVGVGDLDEVQLFYYFIESERDPVFDPLLLWLTGGPGCSALSGLIYETGPLTFDFAASATRGNKPTLKLNPYSWTKVASIIFVDEPVGTGFSYATNSQSYNISSTLAAEELYTFLRKVRGCCSHFEVEQMEFSQCIPTSRFVLQWLITHTQFIYNPLYVAGDSYSGLIIPQIVQKIVKGNEVGTEPPMNLKGYVMGNPTTDENIDYNSRVDFAYRVNLISEELYMAAKEDCHGQYKDVDPSNEACISDVQAILDCTSRLDPAQILEPNCEELSPKPKDLNWNRGIPNDLTDYIRPIPRSSDSELWCRSENYIYIYIWANDKTVQEALNIRPETISTWVRCNHTLQTYYIDDVKSVVKIHQELTSKDYRVLIYSGDHDMVVPYVGTQTWINLLNLSVDDTWSPWFVDGQVAGYTKRFRNNTYTLTYATLKGAGHTAPEYKPKEALAMVRRWFAHYHL